MPENTEVLNKKDEIVAPDVEKDSGTDSDSDDSIPELEETGAGGAQTQGTNPLGKVSHKMLICNNNFLHSMEKSRLISHIM